jgi:two-component system, OmpR family, KDP operon response regulator KdpE
MNHEQPQSVLLCDSQLQSIRALKDWIRAAGIRTYATQTAHEALTQAALRVPDAAIVEMDLVDSTGTEICRRLREWSSMPLIVLSGVTDEDVMLDAFAAGVDDYITKPFGPRELIARLRARLRRATGPDAPVILCGGVEIDLAARVVRRDAHEIHLTPIEYRLLTTLIRNRGRLLTHDALLLNVWGVPHAEGRTTLRAHVANLRRKLAWRSSGGPIRTYPGVGYFVDPGLTQRNVGASRSTAPRLGRVA